MKCSDGDAAGAAGRGGDAAGYRGITHHSTDVDGVRVFHREAGPADAPVVVMLHGFPSSSRMFKPLLPLLSDRYRAIAPDYPGFGHSDAPSPERYVYTFDQLAATIGRWLEVLGIGRYVLVMQDYGGPVGFRLALRDTASVRAVVIQNANAYAEGLGPKWTGIARYWRDRAGHADEVVRFMSLEAARQRHLGDSPHPERYDPDSWADEHAMLSRPGQAAIQADLLYDYRTNPARYPAWQAWMRRNRPPALVLWGRHDPSFLVPGALAYARDLPDAQIHLLDAGHFALDEAAGEVACLLRRFLDGLPGEHTLVQ